MIKMLKCIMHDFIDLEFENIYKSKRQGLKPVLSEVDLNYIENN
jgi:hypothetical protein